MLGEAAPEGGGADSPALWTMADMRSTSHLTGVPAMAKFGSLSPSHSRWAPYLFSSIASLNFSGPAKKKKKEINENAEEDQLEIKI